MTGSVQALEPAAAETSNGWKAYPAYKESGLPWVGSIPAQWSEVPLRAICKPKKVVNQHDRQLLSVYLNRGVVRFSDVDEKRTNPTSEDLSNYQAVDTGDFVLNNQQAWRGSVGVSPLSGIVSPAYLVLSLTSELNPQFANVLFRERSMVAQYLTCSKGVGSIQRNLYWPHLRSATTVLPPPEDQAAILRFLSYYNHLIRRYIQGRQKLIALLTEQKQAIIQHAVTRGLNPDVKLKPSGVEWLGDIPEHWDLLALKRVARFKGGAGFPVGDQGREGFAIPFLKVSDMNRAGNEKWMDGVQNTVKPDTAKRLGAFVLPASSIVFPKVGGAMLTNKRRLLRRPSCIDNNMMGCVLERGDLEFMFLVFSMLDFGKLSKPGPVPAIGEGEVRQIRIGFPPVEEQIAIVQAVQENTGPLSAAIDHAEREIVLMREYRTRLTADVVTGKIDVREAAAALPAAEDASPIDDTDLDETTDAEEALDVAE